MASYVLALQRTCSLGIHRASGAECFSIILSAPLYIRECKQLPSSSDVTNPSDCAGATKRRELIVFKRCHHFYQHLVFPKSPKHTSVPLILHQRGSLKYLCLRKYGELASRCNRNGRPCTYWPLGCNFQRCYETRISQANATCSSSLGINKPTS